MRSILENEAVRTFGKVERIAVLDGERLFRITEHGERALEPFFKLDGDRMDDDELQRDGSHLLPVLTKYELAALRIVPLRRDGIGVRSVRQARRERAADAAQRIGDACLLGDKADVCLRRSLVEVDGAVERVHLVLREHGRVCHALRVAVVPPKTRDVLVGGKQVGERRLCSRCAVLCLLTDPDAVPERQRAVCQDARRKHLVGSALRAVVGVEIDLERIARTRNGDGALCLVDRTVQLKRRPRFAPARHRAERDDEVLVTDILLHLQTEDVCAVRHEDTRHVADVLDGSGERIVLRRDRAGHEVGIVGVVFQRERRLYRTLRRSDGIGHDLAAAVSRIKHSAVHRCRRAERGVLVCRGIQSDGCTFALGDRLIGQIRRDAALRVDKGIGIGGKARFKRLFGDRCLIAKPRLAQNEQAAAALCRTADRTVDVRERTDLAHFRLVCLVECERKDGDVVFGIVHAVDGRDVALRVGQLEGADDLFGILRLERERDEAVFDEAVSDDEPVHLCKIILRLRLEGEVAARDALFHPFGGIVHRPSRSDARSAVAHGTDDVLVPVVEEVFHAVVEVARERPAETCPVEQMDAVAVEVRL